MGGVRGEGYNLTSMGAITLQTASGPRNQILTNQIREKYYQRSIKDYSQDAPWLLGLM